MANRLIRGSGAQGIDTSGREPIVQNLGGVPSWVTSGAKFDMWFGSGLYYGMEPAGLTFSRATVATGLWSNGLLQRFTSGTPVVTDNGLQIWQSTTNICLQSQFAATWTATRSTLTANNTTSPDGTLNAAGLVEDSTATSTHVTAQAFSKAASALAYNYGVYAKAIGRTRIMLQLDDGSGNGATCGFDLSGGQIAYAAAGLGTPYTSIGSQIQSIGNGWYRCTLLATSNTGTTLNANVFLDNGSGTAAQSTSYTGNGSSGLSLFGAQLEQNSILTLSPYISTTTTSQTRNSDLTSFAPGLGSSYAIVWWGIPHAPITFATSQGFGSYDDGSLNNRVVFTRNGADGTFKPSTLSGGSTIYSATGSAIAQLALTKVGISVTSASTVSSSMNGTALTGGSGTSPVSPTTLRFGTRADQSLFWNGTIVRLIVFNNALTSTALNAFTT